MVGKPSRPRELYRDPAHGKIAGVCAGIGLYFGWPIWPIRFVLVLLALFTQVFPLIAAYLIAWFVLDPVSSYAAPGLRGQVDGWVRHTRGRWDQGRSPAEPEEYLRPETQNSENQNSENQDPENLNPEPRPGQSGESMSATARARSAAGLGFAPVIADLEGVEAAFDELERRVQAMERHVTEPAFVLRQQIHSL